MRLKFRQARTECGIRANGLLGALTICQGERGVMASSLANRLVKWILHLYAIDDDAGSQAYFLLKRLIQIQPVTWKA